MTKPVSEITTPRLSTIIDLSSTNKHLFGTGIRLVQPALSGLRVAYQGGTFYASHSREFEFPHLKSALNMSKLRGFALEGTITLPGYSQQEIQRIIDNGGDNVKHLQFWIRDLVDYSLPTNARYLKVTAAYNKSFHGNTTDSNIRLVPTMTAVSPEAIAETHQHNLDAGYSGSIVSKPVAKYTTKTGNFNVTNIEMLELAEPA